MPRLDAKTLLTAYELAAKRRLSQNFLRHPRIVDDIVAAVAAESPRALVEIGPGLGALTGPLAELGVPLIAIDKDPALVDVLRGALAAFPHVEVRHGDALEHDLGALFGEPAVVVGNLPYHITTPILLGLHAARARTRAAIVMVQKEFADRLVSPPGSKTYGSLSVLFRMSADVTRVLDAPPSAFLPAPSVWSSVVRFRWLEAPRAEVPTMAGFERVVRAAFAQRRKTLRNTLGAGFGRERAEQALAASGIDPTRRAETLDVDEFAALARAIG